jgi:hypothetical protein
MVTVSAGSFGGSAAALAHHSTTIPNTSDKRFMLDLEHHQDDSRTLPRSASQLQENLSKS